MPTSGSPVVVPSPADPGGGRADVAREVHDGVLIEQSMTVPERFTKIFDRCWPVVHRYLARRVGPVAADDLAAETFLVAFRQRAHFEVTQPDAMPWLYGIATNVLRRHRRAEIRQYRALARTGVDHLTEADTDTIVDRVDATALSRRLGVVLADLSARERDVLLLVAWEQLSYTEVAQALGIPVGTVRSRLHSARRRLRAALADLSTENTERTDQP